MDKTDIGEVMKEMKQIYAFVATDEEGVEGIVAFEHNGLMMPMVCTDLKRVDMLMCVASSIARDKNIQISIFKFSHKELHGVLNPHH